MARKVKGPLLVRAKRGMTVLDRNDIIVSRIVSGLTHPLALASYENRVGRREREIRLLAALDRHSKAFDNLCHKSLRSHGSVAFGLE